MMIEVSRLNGKSFILNSDLIKYIEETPDTLITLTTGEKIMVREKIGDVVSRVTEYRKRMIQEPPMRKPEGVDEDVERRGYGRRGS